MSTELKAPAFPESVQDGTVATWYKQPGDEVARDELVVDIETDKVVLEVQAPVNGTLGEIKKQEGDTVLSKEVLGTIEEGQAGKAKEKSSGSGDEKGESKESGGEPSDKKKESDQASQSKESTDKEDKEGKEEKAEQSDKEIIASPSARKMAEENNIDLADVEGTGKDGRITKEDVVNAVESASDKTQKAKDKKEESQQKTASKETAADKEEEARKKALSMPSSERLEKRVPMTRLRNRIAERLLDVSQNTAMLTTFNEVNMEPVMTLRSRYKEEFEKTHNGTRLGFMGFFVKAAVEALKRFPVVNASIDGKDIVYHGYQDIGVAVSTEKGLVVPVLKNAENMGLADIESSIRDYGLRARDGKLTIDEITGGTFTITNGGVFGSLLSTPILNPPQAAILGMHKIQERPMAVNGEVKVLPMMYLALSYDHRLIDGKDAVQFLVAIKELLEDPARILLEI